MRRKIERVQSSLEIDEDIDLHETGWIIQRIGWGLMLLVLILATLGLFGNGLLSEIKLVAGNTTVLYHKFLRSEADTEMEVVTHDVGGKVRIVLSPDFIDLYKFDRITPEPSSQKVENGYTILEFPAKGQARLVFFFSIREGMRGRIHNTISVNNTDFELNHYIYP
ncbi:MAG: hypothetical protein M3Y60_02760 [Bacteroidota bacterium]|nr:hypothetical protein [Bacteroidota bacterium]